MITLILVLNRQKERSQIEQEMILPMNEVAEKSNASIFNVVSSEI